MVCYAVQNNQLKSAGGIPGSHPFCVTTPAGSFYGDHAMYEYNAMKVKGKRIDEHRLIVQKRLGRKLDRKEVVHHKDGDRRNNDPDNLQLMTLSEHTKLHFPDGPPRNFRAFTAKIESRMDWSKEKTLQLLAMLSEGSSKVAISRRFKVSTKFIFKISKGTSWVYEYYNIPTDYLI